MINGHQPKKEIKTNPPTGGSGFQQIQSDKMDKVIELLSQIVESNNKINEKLDQLFDNYSRHPEQSGAQWINVRSV